MVTKTLEGNEAAAAVAYRLSEVIALYPITPSSGMGELADGWAAAGRPNLSGTVPSITEMQSEAGAAGALHGALQAGALCTTFTASQGLLLMIPDMYKIAGELTPFVMHVSARSLATHALSIFGDHSDVMAARATGFALLASGSVQEIHDLAAIAHAATLQARLPFLHFFDGFRSSHEVARIDELSDADLRALIDDEWVLAHRSRRLTPEAPMVRGTAQNPDVFFQGREAANPYYAGAPELVQEVMDRFARRTGRRYRLFDYIGAADAERVVVMMGSGAEAAHETVDYLSARGEKVGLIKVRLYRPFSATHLAAALPATTKAIAVLDRTKEPGAAGEPLYLDVVAGLAEVAAAGGAAMPPVVGGRYGLGSKELTPAMVRGVLDELRRGGDARNHFTVGITDDVTHTSLDYDHSFTTEDERVTRAVFYGLGADGTVSANRNAIKIIGEATQQCVQGFFVYDSRKSGAVTVSHLRFGPGPIRSSYLIQQADFVACHQTAFLHRWDILATAAPGATVLLNMAVSPDKAWDTLPRTAQRHILDKQLTVHVIDAYAVARAAGLGGRINTVMQTCFFALTDVLPREQAAAAIKEAIGRSYAKRGGEVVARNCAAVDAALDHLHPMAVPGQVTASVDLPPPVPAGAPESVRTRVGPLLLRPGDQLAEHIPVSCLPADGTFAVGTSKWEKRNTALEVPVWDPDLCIQCNKCVLVCPHAVIRAKVYEEDALAGAPQTFKSARMRGRGLAEGARYTLQVAPEDCTGCGLCVEVCPARDKQDPERKALRMAAQAPLRAPEAANWEFFLGLPDVERGQVKVNQVKGSQFLRPLFEFSGACAGCGETPYLKLVTQLFGDRCLIANATGCSSIYGGNLPTSPWTTDGAGRGPAWSNSLFEDNAEFGLGMRLTLDKHAEYARELLARLRDAVGCDLTDALLKAEQSTEAGIHEQRQRLAELSRRLDALGGAEARRLRSVADALARQDVWIVGGDGWAYDIGYGGLDHVLAAGRDVNILVMDTEVYSNTGGQMSKATPRGAAAKFAAAGKATRKKDLARMAMAYGEVYVATVALGADDTQTVRAILEAERYPGPSLVLAYSHCIAHGIDMRLGLEQQKLAVASGHWPLFRYNPDGAEAGGSPLTLDSKAPSVPLQEYVRHQARYRSLLEAHPDEAAALLTLAQRDVEERWAWLEGEAARHGTAVEDGQEAGASPAGHDHNGHRREGANGNGTNGNGARARTRPGRASAAVAEPATVAP